MKTAVQNMSSLFTISRRVTLLLVVMLCTSMVLSAQTISGQVTDEASGEPLPGVNILAKGTTQGTVTSVDGTYRLTVADNITTLVFSSVGYLSTEVEINGRSEVNIAMAPDVRSLDEIVVVGYGTQRKSDLTGSITSVNGEDIQVGALNSLEKQLGGRAAGVNVTSMSGQPGSATSIRIRGTNSISGNNEPLFVVDGVIYGNELGADINPYDIQSIEILKDASATAIYGSRGANGVVLITTKKGRVGKPQVSLEAWNGLSWLDKKIDLLNAEEIAGIHRLAIANGVAQFYDPDTISGPGTDWQDELYQPAHEQNYQLSVSGGNQNITYMLSGNYLDQEGIVPNSRFQRYALRSNIEAHLNDKISVGSNLYLTKTRSNQSSEGDPLNSVVGSALVGLPIFPVTQPDGNYTLFTDLRSRVGNPVGEALKQQRENNNGRVLANVFGKYDILENLTFNVSLGVNLWNTKNNSYFPSNSVVGRAVGGRGNVRHNNTFNWVFNNILTYNKSFENEHSLTAMIGFTAEKNHYESVNASAEGFTTDFMDYHSLGSAENQFTSTDLNENQLASFLSRINYNIKDKYLITFTGRYDGSSKFGRENQWAFFPSGAIAWRISNEEFFQTNNFLNDLKLRASVGVSGEQAIASYQTLPSLGTTATLYAENTFRIGFYPNRLANPELQWEETQQMDLGLDAGFLNGRVNLTADVYYKKTSNLLYEKAIPSSSGFSSYQTNLGAIENKGVEFTLNTVNTTGEFQWNTDFNISLNRNKVLDLGDYPDGSPIELIVSPSGSVGSRSYLGDKNALVLGGHLGGAYGWVFEGTYKSQAEVDSGPEPDKKPGDQKLKDLDGDGDVDQDDRRLISNPYPKFSGGFNNTFAYKGFELSVFLQFVYGNEIYSFMHNSFSYLNGFETNLEPWALDAWSEENSDSNIPRVAFSNRENGINTFHVLDGSYLRARNITLGYNFPVEQWGWKMSGIKVYGSIDNAFTITNYPYYNPDTNRYGGSVSSGWDEATYPLAKTFIFGVNVTL